ncbi:MAG: protein TolQ [Sphingomonadaceae bacterium]
MGGKIQAHRAGPSPVTDLAASDMMSPVALFLQADIVVKIVIAGLLLASIWTWAIIIAHALRLSRVKRKHARFERDFWKAEDIDRYYEAHAASQAPGARIVEAGLGEWRRSTAGKGIDKEGTRARLAVAMQGAAAAEIDRLSNRLNILATVGSVAPFVGLFGTVWGIMRAFADIAGANSTSLAVVAPGIAEALFATALGLFAAIPAVIAYNRFTHGINRLEARLLRFGDGFHAMLSRELEQEG